MSVNHNTSTNNYKDETTDKILENIEIVRLQIQGGGITNAKKFELMEEYGDRMKEYAIRMRTMADNMSVEQGYRSNY